MTSAGPGAHDGLAVSIAGTDMKAAKTTPLKDACPKAHLLCFSMVFIFSTCVPILTDFLLVAHI